MNNGMMTIIASFTGAIFALIFSMILTNQNRKIKKRQLLSFGYDMLRHCWRNAIVLSAINVDRTKYSPRHILKIKELDQSCSFFLSLDTLNAIPKNLVSDFHTLQLHIKNIYVDVDVTAAYLSSPRYNRQVMKQYLDALINRQSHLANMTFSFMKKIDPNITFMDARSFILNKRKGNWIG